MAVKREMEFKHYHTQQLVFADYKALDARWVYIL